MSRMKKYGLIQTILCLLALLCMTLARKEYFQYSCFFFPFSIFSLFVFVHKDSIYVSRYLKNNNPGLYKKILIPRQYYKKDLFPVHVFALKKSEIESLTDRKIIRLIFDLKLAHRIFFI